MALGGQAIRGQHRFERGALLGATPTRLDTVRRGTECSVGEPY